MSSGRLNIINRDSYKTFQPSPIEEYKTNVRIKSVNVRRISHDEKYRELQKRGLNIDIDSSEIYVNNKKPINGIFSPLFGADTTQDSPVYTCECHKMVGAVNRGRICPDCGTEVRSIEADLRITGYIDIAPYHILSYHGYIQFGKLIKNLDELLTTTKRINTKGKIVDDGKYTIMDLYEVYDDVFKDRIGLPKNVIFMSKIPVYTSRLRPLMRTGMNMTMLDVNKYYLSIVNSANILKAAPLIDGFKRDIEIQRTLNQIQTDFNNVCIHVNSQINDKGGVFRKSLASGRIDNSSRMVITLGRDLMPHEIDVPYQTMMTMYEEEIANYYSKIENVSIAEAISEVEKYQVTPNNKFRKIIKQFLNHKNGVWTLVNRNPTISESGILYCRIRKIHDNPTDYTLHLPPDILVLMAADFDGDQVTDAAQKNPMFHKYFIVMCPTYAFIDRATGHFNRAMDFKKDYSAIISAAWDIDTAYDNYLTNPDENTDEELRKRGLLYDFDMSQWDDIITNLIESDRSPLRDRFIDPTVDFNKSKISSNKK